jgi:hypothetical protein
MNDDISLGRVYDAEGLPENEMNGSGNLEWLGGDDAPYVLVTGGKHYRFRSLFQCVEISNITDDGLEIVESVMTKDDLHGEKDQYLTQEEFFTLAHAIDNDTVENVQPLVEKYGWKGMMWRFNNSCEERS